MGRIGQVLLVGFALSAIFSRTAKLSAVDSPLQIALAIENNQFQPAEVKVPAGAGSYSFVDDFHRQTTGRVVAE